ncbi:MAG: GumC family protein [Sphingobacteriales bacterium]|jgi:tyrosine-protein kinase Etk/Wzc
MSDSMFTKLDGLENSHNPRSPKEILLKNIRYLPWILASLFLCLLFAFIKLRYTVNIYNVQSSILVKDPNAYKTGANKFDGLFFAQTERNLDDEILMISSRAMAKRVAQALHMEVQYYNRGKVKTSPLHKYSSPFLVDILNLKDSSRSFTIQLQVLDETKFRLLGAANDIRFGQAFETKDGLFILQRTREPLSSQPTDEYFIGYSRLDERAIEILSGFKAMQSGESQNILQLNYQTPNQEIGVEVLNEWMRQYQQSGLEEKQQIAHNSLRFIDSQMDTVKSELGGVEKNLQVFREKNQVINPLQQSESYFDKLSELDREITSVEVKQRVLDNLISYIGDQSNPHRKVGSLLGIDEPSLLAQIERFNDFQVQRETLLQTIPESNQIIQDLNTSIEKLRSGILQNLDNVKQSYKISLNSLNSKNKQAGMAVSQLPAKEKELLDISRRQKILEELYSFLLQRKLETSIGAASTISNVRVIEPAVATDIPVYPSKASTYTLAFLLGLFIPVSAILIMDLFNDRVSSREDVQKVTSAPIIGEVSHSDEENVLVVNRTSRRFIAEQFRIIRTNLQYVLPKQDKFVLMITSSASGEGKSFISTNVGAVMAITGKKTAILEFDIRKPKIMSTLGLQRKSGVTNYIIGKASYEELIVKVPQVDNLYVIPCGPVPPNPSELFLTSRLTELMDRLKQDFDVLVIDTAPIGLVSDSVILGKFADATLYVVRHNQTFKKQLQLLRENHSKNRLPRISIVINDIKANSSYGRYYGYGGNGYEGYGYGYGTQYFEDEISHRGFFGRLKKIFKTE